MEQLYQTAGTFRQAFHQWMQPSSVQILRTPPVMVLDLARKVRRKFLPGSSAREVYAFIRKTPDLDTKLLGWGKHSFEKLCLNNGLRILTLRFRPITTIRGDYVFDNLIAGRIIRDINKIWVCDICYIFSHEGKLVGYAIAIIDVYSRLLLALHFSKTMTAEDTIIPAFKQALKMRKGVDLTDNVFHSDGGRQFIQKHFLKLLKAQNMLSSMAKNCYENAFAEAFNDTLKNHILTEFTINSFSQLKAQEKFIKFAYNNYKPHTGIRRFTPVDYEKHIANLKSCQRTTVEIKVIA